MTKSIANNLKGAFLVLMTVAIATYAKVPFIFFQQDEWYSFGTKIFLGWDLVFYRFEQGDINHFVPLGNLISLFVFNLFQVNHIGYNLVGLAIHFLNGFLIFILGRNIFKNSFTALLAAVIFLTFSSASEMVMWPLVSLNTLSLTFVLLCWHILDCKQYLRHPLAKAGVCGLLMVSSMAVIEYSAGLLIFMPLVFSLQPKQQRKDTLLFSVSFILIGLGYLLFRLQNTLNLNPSIPMLNITELLPKIISASLLYFGQLIIGEPISNFVSFFKDTNLLLEENVIFKIDIYLGFLLLAATITLAKIAAGWHLKILLLASLFILLCAVPFVFIPGEAGHFVLYPERYFYFGTAGAALFLGSLLEISWASNRQFLKILAILLIFVYIFMGLLGNWKKQEDLYKRGIMRKKILETIKGDFPQLPKKVVFYMQSDQSYYGLPEDQRVLPFQSGLGQTLLVWFHPTEKFPKDFFAARFLWEISDQGYKETKESGFGYFYDFDLMAESVKSNRLPPDTIVAFKFDSATGTLTNVTSQVRQRFNVFLSEKSEINSKSWSIEASNNKEEANLAIDGNNLTAWSSKLPIVYSQNLLLDLKRIQSIASIQIDSQASHDQNRNGYQILVSQDNQNWQEVFYEKLYPPKNGLTNIYFMPQKTRFLNIKQIGDHEYAPWVINEIKLYEAVSYEDQS